MLMWRPAPSPPMSTQTRCCCCACTTKPRPHQGAYLQVRLRVQLAEHVQAAGHADVAPGAVAAHEHPYAQRLRRLLRLLRLLERRLLNFPMCRMCLTQARYKFLMLSIRLLHRFTQGHNLGHCQGSLTCIKNPRWFFYQAWLGSGHLMTAIANKAIERQALTEATPSTMSPSAVRCNWGTHKKRMQHTIKACVHLQQALHLVPDGREASPELHRVVGVNGVLQGQRFCEFPTHKVNYLRYKRGDNRLPLIIRVKQRLDAR